MLSGAFYQAPELEVKTVSLLQNFAASSYSMESYAIDADTEVDL